MPKLPQNISIESLKEIAGAIRGRSNWRSEPVLAGVHEVIGFGLYQISTSETALGSTEPLDDDAALSVIDSAITQAESPAIGGPVSSLIAGIILKKLVEYLLRKIPEIM